MSNEIAVTTNAQVATSLNDFFGNIDFEQLNQSINKLANHGELTKVEKKSAMEIIENWNQNVIEKINLERKKIDTFVSALQSTSRYGGASISSLISDQLYITELEFLVDKVNMRNEYEQLIDAMDEYAFAVSNEKNQADIVIDLDTTAEDEILQRKDIQLEAIRKKAAVTRAGNKIAKLNTTIVQAINADKEILSAIRALKRKSTLMQEAEVQCTDKADLAKINVTIDNADVREALAELINFKL